MQCAGLHMLDGKVIPRELTEEERAEADAGIGAAKGGGKPPAKDAKKGAKEEEVAPEELERLEKEKAEEANLWTRVSTPCQTWRRSRLLLPR